MMPGRSASVDRLHANVDVLQWARRRLHRAVDSALQVGRRSPRPFQQNRRRLGWNRDAGNAQLTLHERLRRCIGTAGRTRRRAMRVDRFGDDQQRGGAVPLGRPRLRPGVRMQREPAAVERRGRIVLARLVVEDQTALPRTSTPA
jgi:hypothetical protein